MTALQGFFPCALAVQRVNFLLCWWNPSGGQMVGRQLAVWLAAVAGMTAPAIAQQITPATFETTMCPDRIAAGIAAGEKVDCGVLIVPETRRTTSARMVRLPVTIFRSRSATPAADPLVFLAGGPGLSNTGPRSGASDPFLEERDRIYLEPRGATFSAPRLECPEFSEVKLEIASGRLAWAAQSGELVKAARTCRTRLSVESIDLSGYVSTETADDIEDLRVAMGLGQVSLYGLSYGARLALTMMRRHPASVRSVILDSVLPPEVDFDETASNSILRTLNMVFDGCAVDADCAAAYPDLRTRFAALIAEADRKPLSVGARDAYGRPVIVRSAQVAAAFYDALHDTKGIGGMPKLIVDVANGRHDLLKPMFEGMGASGFEWGLRLSVWCAEEMPFEHEGRMTAQVSPALGLGGVDERTATPEVCRTWNVPAVATEDDTPVTTTTPVLIFSGGFDPDTPTDWARAQLDRLPNARLVVMPGESHAASFGACATGISLGFLRDPSAPLGMDCVARQRGPDFGASVRARP